MPVLPQPIRGADTLHGAADASSNGGRDAIIASARALLKVRPYEQIGVRDVVRHSGVALGTLYRCFSSKEQLYAAVLEQWCDWRTAVEPDGTRAEIRVRARLHLIFRCVERDPHFFALTSALCRARDATVRASCERWLDDAAAWLCSDFATLEDPSASDAAEMLVAVVRHGLRQATSEDGSFVDALTAAHRLVDVIAASLELPEKGERPLGLLHGKIVDRT